MLTPPRARLALVLAALVLSSCATLGGANYYSLDQEWEIGRQLQAELRTKLPLSRDRALNDYVNRMGQEMVRQTTMANRRWNFYVVQDDAVNAFNIPGGAVYINTGLIRRVGSAGELAGAMAHEVAHGVARHGTSRLSKAQETNAIAGAVLGRSGGVEQIAAQIAAQGAFASFSRSDEREADRLGVDLMVASGWDPDGLAGLLSRLAQQEGGGGPAFLRTHPLSRDRMQTVQQLARRHDGQRLRSTDREFASVQRRAR